MIQHLYSGLKWRSLWTLPGAEIPECGAAQMPGESRWRVSHTSQAQVFTSPTAFPVSYKGCLLSVLSLFNYVP